LPNGGKKLQLTLSEMRNLDSGQKERLAIPQAPVWFANMPNSLKALLTILISVVGSAAAFLAYSTLVFSLLPLPPIPSHFNLIAGALCGLLYGLESGLLLSYSLNRLSGWLLLLCDLTWSYPNTLFGLVLGNLFYPFFGSLSRELSEGRNWISYAKQEGTTMQTLGIVNLGGDGFHERIHVFQARLFGPFFLPIFVSSYLVTTTLQLLWTCTLGLILYVCKERKVPYLRPSSDFALDGFFGWICYATPFELWAHTQKSGTYTQGREITKYSTRCS
jgi:hypothetical protein